MDAVGLFQLLFVCLACSPRAIVCGPGGVSGGSISGQKQRTIFRVADPTG